MAKVGNACFSLVRLQQCEFKRQLALLALCVPGNEIMGAVNEADKSWSWLLVCKHVLPDSRTICRMAHVFEVSMNAPVQAHVLKQRHNSLQLRQSAKTLLHQDAHCVQ